MKQQVSQIYTLILLFPVWYHRENKVPRKILGLYSSLNVVSTVKSRRLYGLQRGQTGNIYRISVGRLLRRLPQKHGSCISITVGQKMGERHEDSCMIRTGNWVYLDGGIWDLRTVQSCLVVGFGINELES
jgi:hypothetical protein